MPSYRLSRQAENDIERIGETGIANFGLKQALRC